MLSFVNQANQRTMVWYALLPPLLVLVIALVALVDDGVLSFTVPSSLSHSHVHQPIPNNNVHQPRKTSSLYATKQKKKTKSSSGGGFGNKSATTKISTTVSADKHALEAQWDNFASITDLEIAPVGDPDDEDYKHFIVADVFVRVGPVSDDCDSEKGETGWYRTGKVVAAGDNADINAAVTIQKGLILWTSIHMWPAIAAKGKDAAKRLQVGIMPPTLNMADETDTTLDEEDAEDVVISQRTCQGVSPTPKDVGFRPDFNPPGFTYKRREKAAMKKRKSAIEEIVEAT